MVWHLRVVDGPYQSVEVEKKSHLTSDKAIERLRSELKILGVEAKDGEDFETKKQGLIGKRIVVEADINDHGFHVYYIKGFSDDVGTQQPQQNNLGW